MWSPLSSGVALEFERSCSSGTSVKKARYGGIVEVTDALRLLVEAIILQNVKENSLLIQLRELEQGVMRLRRSFSRLKTQAAMRCLSNMEILLTAI
ncbi:hypothetical protein Aduo_005731 [Ancylostoma duodenale]